MLVGQRISELKKMLLGDGERMQKVQRAQATLRLSKRLWAAGKS